MFNDSKKFMALRLPLILSALWLMGTLGLAATADDFFHSGAQQYIFGKMDKAKETTQKGLLQFPEDSKLRRLEELLKQQQQQSKDDQNKKDDQQKNDQKQDQEQSKQDQSKQDQSKQDQEKQQQNQQDSQKDQEKQAQQQKDQQNAEKQGDASKPEDQSEEQKAAQAGRAMAGRMTVPEALKLLNTTKDDENMMPFYLQLRTNRNQRVLKNW